MEEESERSSLVAVRPAAFGWKAKPHIVPHGSPSDDRSRWRPTRKWAVRSVERSLEHQAEHKKSA